jgi:hypothetical protein
MTPVKSKRVGQDIAGIAELSDKAATMAEKNMNHLKRDDEAEAKGVSIIFKQ